jgi:hypothetical protein
MSKSTLSGVLCLALMPLTIIATTRAADPPKPPGVIVAHRPAKTKQYLGSPSLAVLPNGEYLLTHDFFGPGTTYDRMHVYASADQGKTWTQRAALTGQWWSTVFVHRDAVYLMGTTKEYGACVIRRSTDNGKTWTTPKDEHTGLLHGKGMYHCAPVPLVIHNGRLWRAMEEYTGPKWGAFKTFMMSIPVEADLLQASNWTSSTRLERNGTWLDGKFGGWLEGNAVVTPQGELVNILRADYRTKDEKAAIVRISADGKTAQFDPKDFIDFPGGCKKFTIRYDATSKRYWTLSNYVPEAERGPNPERQRNTLALMWSTDLRTWEKSAIILQHADAKTHGFQYADWLIDGTDLIAAVRTAFDDANGGAHNQHDANFVTFHRIKDFRTLGK